MSLSNYIRALRENRALGVAETSSYGALQALLDSVGSGLRPSPVRCILHPSGQGAGLPDGGLFTREQLQPLGREFDPTSALRLIPARGALEVKGTEANLQQLIASKQVAKYLNLYRKVICTNYREFAVVELQGETPRTLETFSFAPGEAAFWTATGDLNGFLAEHEESFRAFCERALLYGAPLASPEAVASFMASCAREAKVRVDRANVDALERVRGSLEAALNVSFRDEEADAFFRSSLVQTLFYGVFSAWILWCRQNPVSSNARFDWRLSAYYLPVPVIQALFHEFSNPQTLQNLNVVEPLDWVTDALNRVDRPEFEQRFGDGSAVQYFYEPFLEAFDPELRKQLGVWYTPISIVRYMVARVDSVLKTELGIAKGLADPSVVVLDPCCGTGAFLVEVIRHIAQTLAASGEDALGASDLKSAVLGRLFGFELLTAPFVVAHLQLGLLLKSLGADLVGDERAPIFLTNALTGWHGEPPQKELQMEGLRKEYEAASKVKDEQKILVIIGNPPYSGYAGIAIGEERELSEAYRRTVNPDLPDPEGQGLNELYVRFFRMAERKITEGTGKGIVCYISNYSWLDGKSHPAMREAYQSRFSKIWIDNLHGDRRISEYAPDGRTSETMFAVQGSSTGIRVGTSIALMVRKKGEFPASILYRDVDNARAEERRQALIESLATPQIDQLYRKLEPEAQLGLPFKPSTLGVDYRTWKQLPELFPKSFPGVKTSRDDVVVDVDRQRLEARMTAYFDANISDEEMSRIAPDAMKSTNRFNAITTRQTLQGRGFLTENVVRYFYRPFDVRWLYWEPETKLLDEKRADYWPHVFEGNLWIEGRSKIPQLAFDRGLATPHMGDNMGNGLSLYFPLYLRDLTANALFAEEGHFPIKANLSAFAIEYSIALGLADGGAKTLFLHALAIQHAPRYRHENADALRLDWPRVPLPAVPEMDDALNLNESEFDDLDEAGKADYLEAKAEHDQAVGEVRALLEISGNLGQRVAALLDVSQPVEGVTENPRAELRILGVITKTDGGALKPEEGHLAVTVNWGYRANGAVMPGNGRAVERPWTNEERAALQAGAVLLALDLETVLLHLGETCFDVYLNDVAFWRGVPSRVWSYTMGGYRVLKKWLSYRETDVLGRDLTSDEAREATAIVRRIAALLLLEPQLDANYAAFTNTATPTELDIGSPMDAAFC